MAAALQPLVLIALAITVAWPTMRAAADAAEVGHGVGSLRAAQRLHVVWVVTRRWGMAAGTRQLPLGSVSRRS